MFWDRHCQGEDEQPWQEWDYVFAMTALYKMKRYEDCLQLYREFHHAHPSSSLLDDRMGWAVYHVHLKGYDFKTGDNARYLKQVDFVLHHGKQGPYSPVALIVGQVVRAILSGWLGQKIDYQRANDYLDHLDPKKLPQEERTYQQDDGKMRRLASEQEKWYAYKSKILLKLKQYDACISCCDQALAVINRFHTNNGAWIALRKIEALIELDRTADAKAALEHLLQRPARHWKMDMLGYRIAVMEHDEDAALKYIGEAALLDPNHGMRVQFYEETASFLNEAGHERMAMLQYHLVDLLREENGWKIKPHYVAGKIPEDIAAMDKPATLRELREFWRAQRDKDKVFLEGQVKKILPSGRSGFIEAAEGKSYYFSFADVQSGRKHLAEGLSVRFTLAKRMDRKKNRLSDNAVEITVEQK
ncbi:MAG: hypothetical protein UDD25_08395 [Mitsuokella jalaludinii]|nr:hypothetical protein [Mitsuokella jalaludinii]